ncbi:MAG: hypothetical protein ACUVTQ_10640 [Desulfotomaculales bacterium]
MTGNIASVQQAQAGQEGTGRTVELLVVAVEKLKLRCLRLPERRPVILRPAWGDEAEGEILEVLPRKEWRFGRTDYLAGEIVGSRIDAAVLSPVPLELYNRGLWDPHAEFLHLWEEDEDGGNENLPEWVRAVLRADPRREYEMQQVIPGADPEDLEDPITEAVYLVHAGDFDRAFKILRRCLEADQRCSDAYVRAPGTLLLRRRALGAMDPEGPQVLPGRGGRGREGVAARVRRPAPLRLGGTTARSCGRSTAWACAGVGWATSRRRARPSGGGSSTRSSVLRR